MRQATIQGFEGKGFSRAEGEALLEKSVKIALDARDIYNERSAKGSWDGITEKRRPILVAASVGSYGAYLADGSEYRSVNILESIYLPVLNLVDMYINMH